MFSSVTCIAFSLSLSVNECNMKVRASVPFRENGSIGAETVFNNQILRKMRNLITKPVVWCMKETITLIYN
jgi:hypothetical protein